MKLISIPNDMTKFNIDDIMKLVISRFSVLEQTEGYKFNYFCNGK